MPLILLKSLALELGVDRSALRKAVLRDGIPLVRVRAADTRGQQALALTEADAARVREGRQIVVVGGDRPSGSFYSVLLHPEVYPRRVKLGFSASLPARLAYHLAASPTAVLLGSWPCRRAWEAAAIASATRTGCVALGEEVFDVDSIGSLTERADAFFALMPTAGIGRPICLEACTE